MADPAIKARPIRVEDRQCPICKTPARWWTDGWMDCEICGIYDPTDHVELARLRRAEKWRQRDREDTPDA